MHNDSAQNHLKSKFNNEAFSFSTITLLAICLILGGLDIWCYVELISEKSIIIFTCVILTAILMATSLILFFNKKVSWLKAIFVVLVIFALFTWGYYLIAQLGVMEYLMNPEKLQQTLRDVGWWKYLLFAGLQFLQVTFIPLPAMATTLAGTLMFGPAMASLLSFIGIMLGSIVAFIIGDKCGEKVVAWIVGKKQMDKYSNLLYDKGKYMFFLMMLFPLFPDDILCLVAGMSAMSYRFFITTILITRPIGIVLTCYLGSGELIPFTGWGLAVWAGIVIFMVFAFWFTYHYKDKIERTLNRISDFFTKKFGSPREKVFIYLNIKPSVKLLPPPEDNKPKKLKK